MHGITEARIQALSLGELFRLRDATKIMLDLGVEEMDVDTRHLTVDLIQKREKFEGV